MNTHSKKAPLTRFTDRPYFYFRWCPNEPFCIVRWVAKVGVGAGTAGAGGLPTVSPGSASTGTTQATDPVPQSSRTRPPITLTATINLWTAAGAVQSGTEHQYQYSVTLTNGTASRTATLDVGVAPPDHGVHPHQHGALHLVDIAGDDLRIADQPVLVAALALVPDDGIPQRVLVSLKAAAVPNSAAAPTIQLPRC